MKDLLAYILEGITGQAETEIEEIEENSHLTLKVSADPAILGLIIGKGGQTIKAIQTLLRVRGRIDGKSVFVSVSEKGES